MSRYDKKEKRASFIFIIVFILLAAGISFSGYVSYSNFEQQFKVQAGRQLSSIAKLKMNGLVDWRRARMADGYMLYQNHVFATLVQTYFENPTNLVAEEQLQGWLMNYQENIEYSHVRLIDAKGQIRLSYPVGLQSVSSDIAGHIPEVLKSKQMTLFDFYRTDTNQNTRLSLLVPIMDVQTGEQVIGLVAISIDPEVYLYPYIEEWPIESSTSETLLISREGNDAVFLNNLRFDPEAALTLRFPLTNTELPAVKAALGQTGIVQGLDYRGEPVLADVRPVPDSPWFLISKMDVEEVDAPLTTRLWQTFLLAGLAIIAMGAGLMTVWRQQRVEFYRTQADAAKAVRESEKKYRALVENMQVGVVVHAPDTRIVLSNPIASELLGLTPDQMQGKTAIDPAWTFIREDGTRRPLEEYPVNRALASQAPISNLILGILRPDREGPTWVQCDVHQDRNSNGVLQQIVVTFFDITERKLAEKKLYESEERFRRAVLGAPFPIMIHAEDGEVVTINNPWIKLTGYNHSDIPTIADWTQKAYGTRMETVRADIDSLYALDGPKAEGEYTIMTHAGKARIWDFSSAPIGQLPDGRRLVISMAMDVTNRKRAEIELRETNQYLDNLFNYANAPIIVWDPQFKIARFNHAFEELTGRNENEVLGGALEILFPPNEVESSMELIRKTLTGERWEVVEINILHVDGSIRTVLWNSATLFSAEGRSPMATIAQGQDITERKRVENMLEARLRLVEFAINHSMDELLTKTLDEVCAITDSSIGFYHFVDPGQKVLSLQAWSTRTMQEYCKAEGKGSHYPVEQAGVWADCVREKQVVIHNDYAALPASHRRGLPEGHAELVRELVVPIMRDDLIVAILGVGNKTQDYTKKDIDTVVYFADVAWEIAERKLAEDSLVRSEKKYRELHESMMDGFVSVDMNGKFLECNEVYRKMLGYSEAELKQLTYLDLTPEKWRQYEAEIVESQIMKRGYSDIYEKEYRRKDGTIFPAELHTILSRDENGNPVNMWAIARDITERKQAERQLAEHAVQLEEVVNERTRELRDTQEQLVRQEKLAILGQLAGSMGHELRNPLGVISNAIYFLKMAQPDASDKIKEYLNIIENEARTSDKIITDLLDFARVKSVDRQPVSVPEMIHQTLNRFPVPPSVELVLTIPFDLPQIFADPHHMVQILGNLTVNACQALPATGGRLEISVALHHDMVSIAIHDNGTGISPENMNKLFEPLFTTKIKGIGLGLAVSRKLAEANGGRIEVKSEAGQGSTFTIFLPLESREQ